MYAAGGPTAGEQPISRSRLTITDSGDRRPRSGKRSFKFVFPNRPGYTPSSPNLVGQQGKHPWSPICPKQQTHLEQGTTPPAPSAFVWWASDQTAASLRPAGNLDRSEQMDPNPDPASTERDGQQQDPEASSSIQPLSNALSRSAMTSIIRFKGRAAVGRSISNPSSRGDAIQNLLANSSN
ncbi:hypothetical protein ACLOJK_029380 [Asimina triloba]